MVTVPNIIRAPAEPVFAIIPVVPIEVVPSLVFILYSEYDATLLAFVPEEK